MIKKPGISNGKETRMIASKAATTARMVAAWESTRKIYAIAEVAPNTALATKLTAVK